MTKHESFKQRVRERMAKTGERYVAARRALLGELLTVPTGVRPPGPRIRATEPEVDDLSIKRATGRDWDEWCDLIDAWPGHDDGHAAIAAHVAATYGHDGWWSQGITVGYERITGRRVRNQLCDGTFSGGKTRTMRLDLVALRAMLIDDSERLDLFPDLTTRLRSKPTSKALRIGISVEGEPAGSALFSFTPKSDGRVMVNVSHDDLPDVEAVEFWKSYWTDWLAAIDQG